jgi:pyrimidine operon attenuation protein / uracil phosphoribosyltransferase
MGGGDYFGALFVGTTRMSALDFETVYRTLKEQLASYLSSKDITHPLMIGIHAGGAWLAQRLHADLKVQSPLGALSIAYYRDDFASNGLQARAEQTHLPVDVSDRDVVLVDDVLYTGRTVRAAINELFDFGRPRSITLACLIDRGGRQLPIQADVCGSTIALEPGSSIKLRGPAPLTLETKKNADLLSSAPRAT